MKRLLTVILGLAVFTIGISLQAFAAEPNEQQVLVDQAQITLRDFQKAPEMEWFRDMLPKARGVLIVPSLVKAGLIFGGSGGSGVYFAVDKKTGECRGPAFYGMGSFTFGLQAGAEKAQIVILAMTDQAVNAMLSPQFNIGADASVAAGPVGVGTGGQASPLPAAAFIVFSRTQGVFGGLTVEGAIVASKGESNAAYYGRPVTATDILVKGVHSTSGGRNICAMIGKPGMHD